MNMNTFTITPKVDKTQEFIEIAKDFSNPLDLVREAISNSFDAGANNISIVFDVISEYGNKVLMITIKDNGNGMNRDELQSFFDLGNSTRRGDEAKIGEKGHGTKVYLNSSLIEVTTINSEEEKLVARMEEPIRKLYEREVPEVNVNIFKKDQDECLGTTISIKGYNNNRRERFTHAELKDYILWFTKFGSVETFFDENGKSNIVLSLKGLDRQEAEVLSFGHPFPLESKKVNDLFDEFLVAAPDYYCKRFIKSGNLKNHPEISYQAIFSVEGNKIKLSHNPMIRRTGREVIPGSYTVAERYGVWLCKDYIPIQRKNEWVNYKGSEFIKLHAFFNCQGLNLTANRGSIENTPSEILKDIEYEVKQIYKSIIESDDWTQLSWLEQEVQGYRTAEKERKDYDWRQNKIKKQNIAKYKDLLLVEPIRESGVFALALQLMTIEKNVLPFYILDYDTHSGIDVIVKGDDKTPIQSSKLYYVEFKHCLTADFNHSFEHLHSIVCWDTNIKHGEILRDIGGDERILEIMSPATDKDYTKFFLNNPRKLQKIEVFVLKYYLKEKLGIEFKPRTDKDVL